jgi:hypothetical protein
MKLNLPNNFLNDLLYFLNSFYFEKYRFHINNRLNGVVEEFNKDRFIQTDTGFNDVLELEKEID